jgi:hypothetical protein
MDAIFAIAAIATIVSTLIMLAQELRSLWRKMRLNDKKRKH